MVIVESIYIYSTIGGSFFQLSVFNGLVHGGGVLLWWTVCASERESLRRSEAKRADCHDCTAPVREPTDTRRNECAVGTLKNFANLSPHISVQIPLWSTI